MDDGALSLPPSIKKGVKRDCAIPPMRGMLPGASDVAEARATEERAASFGRSSPHLGCVEQCIHQASHLIVACFLCSFLHLLKRASIHPVPDGQQATRAMRIEKTGTGVHTALPRILGLSSRIKHLKLDFFFLPKFLLFENLWAVGG